MTFGRILTITLCGSVAGWSLTSLFDDRFLRLPGLAQAFLGLCYGASTILICRSIIRDRWPA